MLPAVVLAGGEGTRLRPLTERTPKALLPLVGRPLISHVLEELRRNAVAPAILACGYRADALRQTLGDAHDGMPLEYSVEDEPLGTGGAIRLAAAALDTPFVATNGDCLWRTPLEDVLERHRTSGAAATMVVASVDDASAYGTVEAEGGWVTGFHEKLSSAPGRPASVSAGIYVLEPTVAAAIPAGRAVSIERELFPRLAAARALAAVPLEGGFVDAGTSHGYLRAHRLVLDRVRGASRAGPISVDSTARVDEGAEVVAPAFVGAGAVVEPGARVGPDGVVYEGAYIAEGAVIEGSVVGARARIGAGSRVVTSIVGEEAQLGESSRLSGLAVVGPGASLAARTVLAGPAAAT